MSQVERVCSNPSCEKPGKLTCSGCGEEMYCSKECQKSHWSTHKTACKSSSKKSFDALSAKELKNIIKVKVTSVDKGKRNRILSKMEKMVEKSELISLAKEVIEVEEIDGLLTTANKQAEATVSSSSAKGRQNSIKPPKNFETKGMPTPTPDQLRQQAQMMRKNPAMVRKAQPDVFGKLTDQQIREYADQLDQMAKDPSMLKEVEKLSKLNNDDRSVFQSIQEGLTGTKPINDEWITNIINSLKNKPEIFKTMFKGRGAMLGGVTDEQIESYIDMASRMDVWVLKFIAYGIWYLSKAAKPLTEAYQVVDKYTLGSARYILLGIAAMVFYYVSMVLFFVGKFILVQLYGLYLLFAQSGVGASVKKTVTDSVASGVAETVANAAGAAAGQNADFEF